MRHFSAWIGLLAVFFYVSMAQADPLVVVAPSESLQFYPELEAFAQVKSEHEAIIRSEKNALLTHLWVKEGEQVKAGDRLAALHCAQEELEAQILISQMKSEQVNAEFLSWQLAQVSTLSSQAHSSEEQVRSLQSQYEQLLEQINITASRIAQREDSLSKCYLSAPFNGVITEKHLNAGNLTSPGQAVVSLVDTQSTYVLAYVPSQYLPILMASEDLHFVFQEQAYPVQLDDIVPVLDTVNGLQTVRFKTMSQDKALVGAQGRLHWTNPLAHIPASVLVQYGESQGVFVVDDEQVAHFVPILEAKMGQPVPLALLPQRIVTQGAHQLNDGATVVLSVEQTESESL